MKDGRFMIGANLIGEILLSIHIWAPEQIQEEGQFHKTEGVFLFFISSFCFCVGGNSLANQGTKEIRSGFVHVEGFPLNFIYIVYMSVCTSYGLPHHMETKGRIGFIDLNLPRAYK